MKTSIKKPNAPIANIESIGGDNKKVKITASRGSRVPKEILGEWTVKKADPKTGKIQLIRKTP